MAELTVAFSFTVESMTDDPVKEIAHVADRIHRAVAGTVAPWATVRRLEPTTVLDEEVWR